MSFSFVSHSQAEAFVYGHNHIENGRVLGGYAHDTQESTRPHYLEIYFQNGPVNREAGERPNGTFVEDVLEVCKFRLVAYQASDFKHDANAQAIGHIQQAIDVLNERRDERKARGVFGKNVV